LVSVSCSQCLAPKPYKKVEQNGFKSKYECSYCGFEIEVEEYQETTSDLINDYTLIRVAIAVLLLLVIIGASLAFFNNL